MKRLPNCNAVIDYETGDGFKTVLPQMICGGDLIICGSVRELEPYKHCKVEKTTLLKLGNEGTPLRNYWRIIIDTQLPLVGSKSLDALKRLSKNKTLIFTDKLYKPRHINSALYLLFVTKSCYFRAVKFNMFQYKRSYY